jgi:hypothetical protein
MNNPDSKRRTSMKKERAGRARRCTERELNVLAMRMLRQQLTAPSVCCPSSLITCSHTHVHALEVLRRRGMIETGVGRSATHYSEQLLLWKRATQCTAFGHNHSFPFDVLRPIVSPTSSLLPNETDSILRCSTSRTTANRSWSSRQLGIFNATSSLYHNDCCSGQ